VLPRVGIMTQKSIFQMTRKEILAVPSVGSDPRIVECGCLVIIPTRKRHDSGYKIMEVIAVDENHLPIGKITTSADVLNLLNYDQYDLLKGELVPQDNILHEWRIDCMWKSGLLRLFKGSNGFPIRVEPCNMNIEGFVKKKKGE